MNAGTPPTTNEYIAYHNTVDFSSALNTCCEGHTATFGLGGVPDDCYIYCNVTAPATIESIKSCFRREKPENSTGFYISIQGNEGEKSAAVMRNATRGGLMGYLLLGLGFSSAVWGLL